MKNIVIKHSLFWAFFVIWTSCSSQRISRRKIFIKFEIEENCDRNLKFFYKKEDGLVFNLFCKQNGSLLYKTGSDTLPINKLANYKISSLEEVEKMEKKWIINNKEALIKKYGKLYLPFNKNGIFETYLIEIINDDEFVIYPVEWRNLDIAQ